jgi:hypothetical protein
VRTLAYTKDSNLKENIEYDIEGTPCKLVMSGKGSDVFIPSGVDAAYPKEAGYDSYVAVPIYNSSNTVVIGHIAALDDKPMSDDKNQTSILKIFAARAGAEIDRIKAENLPTSNWNRFCQKANNATAICLKKPRSPMCMKVSIQNSSKRTGPP